MLPQRDARILCFEMPARSLERRLRHAMPAHGIHQLEHMSRALDLFTQHHRSKKLDQRRPRSLRPLVAVERSFTGRTLPPSFSAILVRDTCEDNAPFSSPTKACFEKVDERQANLAQFNRLY